MSEEERKIFLEENIQKSSNYLKGQVALSLLTLQFVTFTIIRAQPIAYNEINHVVMFYSEVIKFTISIIFSYRYTKSYSSDISLCIIPFICFCIMNLISLWCLKYLNPTTFMVIMQMKMIWTAFFSQCFLKESMSFLKCCILMLIFNGVLSVGIQKTHENNSGSTFFAIMALNFETILSGFSVNYMQYSFKNNENDLWTRNVQLSFLSIIGYVLDRFWE